MTGDSSRLRQEALTTPFMCLNAKDRPQEVWKVRVLLEGYCKLLTFENQVPTKCMYCLADNPYVCKFRHSAQYLLFDKLFSSHHTFPMGGE